MELSAPWRKFYGKVKPSLHYPPATLWEAFGRIACRYPHYTALIYMNRSITYKEMTKRIIDVQAGLEKIGVRKGDKVLLCLPDIPQAVYLLYALSRMGAVGCFVHPLSAHREVAQYADILESRFIVMLASQYKLPEKSEFLLKNKTVVLTTPADELDFINSKVYRLCKRQHTHRRKDKVYNWHSLMKNKEKITPEPVSVSCKAPAVVLFSGGTTGTPKAVLISSYSLNATAMQTAQMGQCEIRGRKMLTVLPVFHGFGLGVCIHSVLIHGGCSVLVPRFSASICGKIIKKYRPDFIAGVPTMFEALLKSKGMRNADLSCIRGVFSGGDTLSEKLREKFDGYLKEHGATVKIREGYGLTECIGAGCLSPENLHRRDSVGIPFPDMYFKICKVNTTEEAPAGTVGEICITGPTLMLGYLNNKEETCKALRFHSDGRKWLHTGDAGMMDKDGFVYFRERIKRIIVTKGFNVYPSQVEAVLCAHPKVLACCVTGVCDPYSVERVKAFVVPADKNKSEEKLRLELISYCRKNLSHYAVPSEIEFVLSLPKTALNKVDFRKLQKY